jgi:hypothetical protein
VRRVRALALRHHRRQLSLVDRTTIDLPDAEVEDEEGAEEMVKGASVLRMKAEAPATGKLPFDAARRVNYSDYGCRRWSF